MGKNNVRCLPTFHVFMEETSYFLLKARCSHSPMMLVVGAKLNWRGAANVKLRPE